MCQKRKKNGKNGTKINVYVKALCKEPKLKVEELQRNLIKVY